jgi:hypothetical protein
MLWLKNFFAFATFREPQKGDGLSQKNPKDRNAVIPNVLFFFYSMIPAMT